MGTLVYIMKLSVIHSTSWIHVLRFLAIVIFSLAIDTCAQSIEDDDLYEAPQRRSGVSMLRLKKSTDDEVRNHMQDLLYKRAMSMMRLRRAPPAWERPIRGPSMMRLKRRMPSQPMIMKDMEPTLCNDYPDPC